LNHQRNNPIKKFGWVVPQEVGDQRVLPGRVQRSEFGAALLSGRRIEASKPGTQCLGIQVGAQEVAGAGVPAAGQVVGRNDPVNQCAQRRVLAHPPILSAIARSATDRCRTRESDTFV